MSRSTGNMVHLEITADEAPSSSSSFCDGSATRTCSPPRIKQNNWCSGTSDACRSRCWWSRSSRTMLWLPRPRNLGGILRTLILALLLVVSNRASLADDALKLSHVVLLQPESVLQARSGNPEALGTYLKAVIASTSRAVATLAERTPGGGFIVVAVRPGDQSRMWLDFEPKLTGPTLGAIRQAFRTVQPPPVTGGPLVVALKVSLWSGPVPDRQSPMVPEWRRAVVEAGKPLEVGDLVGRIWDDAESPPDGGR